MGDFNCAGINWENRSYDANGEKLFYFAEDNFLKQLVNEPTRGHNILDLILTNEENLITNIRVGDTIGNSDHNLIRFEIHAKFKETKKEVKRLDFRKANWKGLKLCLTEIDFSNANNIYESWNSFKTQLLTKQNVYIPLKSSNLNQKIQPKWISNEIKRAIVDKNVCYKLKKKGPKSPINIKLP
jgi:hypothetical protein